MGLVSLVVGLFDPAGRYMRRGRPGPRRPRGGFARRRQRPFVAGAVFGPDGARQATRDELAAMSERHRQRQVRRAAALRAAHGRWRREALACAGELLTVGTTVLPVDHGQIRGRIVRFWRGDSVLELEPVGALGRSGGRSMIRLARGHERSPDVLAGYLLHQAAQLDMDSEPG